jgi:diaminopimelate decarboxylase
LQTDLLKQAADIYGTPLYVYDLPFIIKRITSLKDLFFDLDFRIAYAMKANFNRDLLKTLNNFGLMIDVVSYGEYLHARSIGFAPDRIIVNGNCKKVDQLKTYVNNGVFSINLDSYEELLRLEKIIDSQTNISIRVNPDVDAKTHPHISTGLKENKFGVDFDTAAAMIRRIEKNKYLKLIGFHCHIGSQITEIQPYLEAITSLIDFIEKTGIEIEILNLGGGWGIDYGDGKFLDLNEYRNKILPLLKKTMKTVIFELGRWITAPAGYLISKVEYVKKTRYKIFVVVDTGMTHLIRPALYGAKHKIIPLYPSNDRKMIVADIVGPACESSDVLRKEYKLPEPAEGELITICDVGAYGFAMASEYNLIPKPIEVIWDGEKFIKSS